MNSNRPKGIIKVWRLDDTNKIDASKQKYMQAMLSSWERCIQFV